MFENLDHNQLMILMRSILQRRVDLNKLGCKLIANKKASNKQLFIIFFECLTLKEMGEELCNHLNLGEKFNKSFAFFTSGEKVVREALNKRIA